MVARRRSIDIGTRFSFIDAGSMFGFSPQAIVMRPPIEKWSDLWALCRTAFGFESTPNVPADRAWRVAADALDGVFQRRRGPGWRAARELIVSVEDLEVKASELRVGQAEGPTLLFTQVRVELDDGPPGLRLKAYGRNTCSFPTGLHDPIDIGDAEFDRVFHVEASDVALAHTWLHRDVREALLDARYYALQIRFDEVLVEREGVEEDPTSLQKAIHAAVTAACGPKKRRGYRS